MSKKEKPKESEHRITAKATIIAAVIAAIATVAAALIVVWFQRQPKEGTVSEGISYKVSGWVGYNKDGSPKQDPISFTTTNVNLEVPIPGEFTGFYLNVEQYTNGKLCGAGEMYANQMNFPPGQGPVDRSGSPGPYFYGGSQLSKDGRFIEVFLHPSNQCK